MKERHIASRHLGLKMPQEKKNLKEQVRVAAKSLAETVDLEALLALGSASVRESDLPGENDVKEDRQIRLTGAATHEIVKKNTILAVAYDEAFCFYYQENLRALEQAGFSLQFFSLVHDKKLPEGASALLLGGGYPELFAKELSENQEMMQFIVTAIRDGMPSVAECGGFMYLHRTLTTEDGVTYPMCNILPEDCSYQGKLVHFGYAAFQEEKPLFLKKGETIKGHEFHYFDSTENGMSCKAVKPTGKREWNCVHAGDNHWWGFPHLYYPSNPDFVAHFYQKALEYADSCEKASPQV